jgi:predicted membrane-bound spermidine synthase
LVFRPKLEARARVVLWLATSTVAGGIIMALELVAFRLYAPYFGYSIYVWGTMISVVMGALAAGYALGGWIGDRGGGERAVYGAVLASALYQLVIVFTAHSILRSLSAAGDFAGTVAATLVIFAPPMLALATVPPLVIPLLVHRFRVGAAAGTVYALSTMGSIAGILATSFWLMPHLGTIMTLELLCAASLLLGVSGLLTAHPAALSLLPLIAVLPGAPGASTPIDTVAVAESPYNYLRVARRGETLILFLNADAAQTVQQSTGGRTGYYYDDFALGPLLVKARQALVLGLGAGGSIAAARTTAPDLEFQAVEIDPKVVEAAARWFGLRLDDPLTGVHVADARRWLAADTGKYDLVQLDAYQGGPYIPFYLVTTEFFRLVRTRMADDGLLMMNLFDISETEELVLATAATLRTVFPTVMVKSRARGSHMLFAFTRTRSIEAVRRQLGGAAIGVSELTPPASVRAFTDDLAPVEEMTRRMLGVLRQ